MVKMTQNIDKVLSAGYLRRKQFCTEPS